MRTVAIISYKHLESYIILIENLHPEDFIGLQELIGRLSLEFNISLHPVITESSISLQILKNIDFVNLVADAIWSEIKT